MRLRKEKAIVTIYDAVSILKGFNVVNGSLTQNYYAESATYVPNRYIIPLVLRPKIDVSDPNNVIENGDKVDELARLEWFYNGDKIISNDDFKIEGANLTIFKNSEEPFEISYKAEWFDSRKKQSITIEDTILVSCMSLAQSEFNARLSLDKPQNWLHNPLKNERIYKIRAYVSKDKVYDGAVAWYYVDSNKKDKLIDETCNFYVGGQNTNELSIDSSYLDSIIIKAKNIDNEKLKEIYWFFDKEGNPITYSEPEKTIIEGKDIFNLPESPITSKLDYRINGLTNEELKSVQTPMRIKSVGGANLYTGTKDFSGDKWKALSAWTISEEKYLGFTVMKRSGEWGGMYQTMSAGNIGDHYVFSAFLKIDESKDKKVACFVKHGYGSSEVLSTVLYHNINEILNKTRGEWYRFIAVIELKYQTDWYPVIEGTGDDDAYIHVCGLKLEKGDKATPWTPAPEDHLPLTGSALYINNQLELKSVGEVSDYIENGKLYKNISDNGEILEKTEVVNLSTSGQIVNKPNGTIFIEPITNTTDYYTDSLDVSEYNIVEIEEFSYYKEGVYHQLDTSKVVIKEGKLTYPNLENTIVYMVFKYDDNPIYGVNSVDYYNDKGVLVSPDGSFWKPTMEVSDEGNITLKGEKL